MHKNPEHQIPHNAIGSIGEASLPEAFKQERDKIVDSVNDWLRHQVVLRDSAGATDNEPRITYTNLGPISDSMNLVGEDVRVGVALLGDPEKDPLVYQRVVKMPNGDVEITQVQGSDPLAVSLYGDQYGISRQSETLASFGTRVKHPDETEDYFKFVLTGAGKVVQQYVEPGARAVNVSNALYSVDQLQMAQAAFQSIVGAGSEQ